MKVLYGVDALSALRGLQEGSVHCVVTSPPYWGLRDYGVEGQIGLEETPEVFIRKMVEVFREVRRVLKQDGTLWLNLGDCYISNSDGAKPQTGLPQNRSRAREAICRSKRIPRGGGRFGGGNNRASGHLKPKDLCGIPWRVAFALQEDGWYLRQDIIWHKPNPMPESVTDRCTKAHEYIFLLSKSKKYYFNHLAIKEPAIYKKIPKTPTGWDTGPGSHRSLIGRYRNSAPKGSFNGKTETMAVTGQNAFRAIVETRNKRSVWSVTTKSYKGAHFATFPPDLIIPCIEAGAPPNGTVLDPFAGSGTVAEVALKLGRDFILIDLNKKYLPLVQSRIKKLEALL